MKAHFNFSINPSGKISNLFLRQHITDFEKAAEYIKQIPYGRNENKKDVSTVFTDYRGTCSSKHALLKELCIENSKQGFKLMLCLFKMNSRNTPSITSILNEHNLDHIPEAHNYLKVGTQIIDCTFPKTTLNLSKDEIILEMEISPDQITDFKVNYHKAYLQKWLKEQPLLTISFEQLWEVREASIASFSMQ